MFSPFFFFIIFVNDLDISMEMETSLDIQSVAGTESSFKYPKDLEERVCTIEEMVLPAPPPPPSTIVKITTRSSNWEAIPSNEKYSNCIDSSGSLERHKKWMNRQIETFFFLKQYVSGKTFLM